MEKQSPPPMGTYRRIQLARWLIDNDRTALEDMHFDLSGRIRDFGLPRPELDRVILSGIPFETSGCPGADGRVACNRPYGNEKPGKEIRNFPFSPDADDLARIAKELKTY